MFSKESSSLRVGTARRLMVLATVLTMALFGAVAPASALPRVGTVTVDGQAGALTAGTGGSATYLVTVTNGDGKNVTAGLSVTAGLPTGATFSFEPTSLAFVTAPAGTSKTSTLTITTSATTPAQNAVPFTVQAVRTNGGNGSDLAIGDGTLTIDPAVGPMSQTIVFDPIPDKTFDDAGFTVFATASSGLPVTFAAAGECTIIAVDSVTITGAGSCTITASQAGDTSYAPAPNVEQTFTIAKASQTITFAPLDNKTVGDPNFTVTATGDTATLNPVTFTASGPCTVTGASVSLGGVGSCTIFASQAGNANYLDAVAAQTFVILPPLGTYANFDLYAVPGNDTTLPGLATLPVWGYNLTGAAATQAGGPTLEVNEGDIVVVTLHNTLSEASSLLFGGQSMIPDTSGAPADGTRSYIFTADNPGTYLYEAGLVPNAQHQVAMGLYGALIVRPPAAPPLLGPLTVVNAGFEENVLSDGAFTTSFAAGWTTTSGGEFNPTTAHLTGEAAEGSNTAYSNGGTISQVLTDTLTEGTTYTLSVEVGDRKDTAFPGYTVELWAGGVLLAFANQVTDPGVDDDWVTAVVTYEAQAGDPLGQPLEIRLISANPQTNFDNVQLTGPSPVSTAYGDAATAYDDEAVLVLSEIDPNLNGAANPAAFDMRNYKPEYFLINGEVYPDTAAIATSAGNNVLLRYVNAGSQFHSMALLGGHQTVIAYDGSLLDYSRRFVSETFGPGQTTDAIVAVPAATVDGSMLAIYDSSLLLHNSNQGGFGGMLTFLEVSGAVGGPDVTGPLTSNVAYAAGTLTATVNDTATGGSNIAEAEYYLDSTAGTAVPMTATDGTFDSISEAVTVAATVPAGSHTLYVRGQDALGNWGAFSSVLVNGGDETGPTTSGLSLTPNPSNGTADVALHATGNDSATGGSDITAAEYWIGATDPGEGLATTMTVNNPDPIASLDAIIDALDVLALTDGTYVVSVRSMDAAGNWGDPVTIDLLVDQTGPVTSNVSAEPNPNNGALGINPSTPSVRVTADLDDTTTGGSNIVAAEGFIGTFGADGTGFVFVATDGLFNSSFEIGFGDIPLTTINQLPDGDTTIYVHGKDAAGNWGDPVTTILVIERDIPTVSLVAVDPASTDGTVLVDLTATATDLSLAIARAEWFAGADPGTGNGTAMAATDGTFNSLTEPLTATIDANGWAPGVYTISVRARDAAGNWSATDSALLTVTAGPAGPPTLLYFSTLGGGGANSVPGVAGAHDDADVYLWDSGPGSFSRILDGRPDLGLPVNADIDGLAFDGGVYYVSFNRDAGTNVPSPGGGTFVAQDEDVVEYDPENGEWQPFFDGSECALDLNNAAGRDIDALDVVGTNLLFSTVGDASVNGVAGPYDDADIYLWDGDACSKVFDAVDDGGLPAIADIDGLTFVDATHFYLSFLEDTTVPGPVTVQDEDVVYYNGGEWSVYFDGTAPGLTGAGQDLDAIDVQ